MRLSFADLEHVCTYSRPTMIWCMRCGVVLVSSSGDEVVWAAPSAEERFPLDGGCDHVWENLVLHYHVIGSEGTFSTESAARDAYKACNGTRGVPRDAVYDCQEGECFEERDWQCIVARVLSGYRQQT